MEIRRLESCEKETAMDLAWRVFQKFEASEYAPEGVQTFHAYITDPAAVAGLTVYGAIAEKPSLASWLFGQAVPTSPCSLWTRPGTGRAWGRPCSAAFWRTAPRKR